MNTQRRNMYEGFYRNLRILQYLECVISAALLAIALHYLGKRLWLYPAAFVVGDMFMLFISWIYFRLWYFLRYRLGPLFYPRSAGRTKRVLAAKQKLIQNYRRYTGSHYDSSWKRKVQDEIYTRKITNLQEEIRILEQNLEEQQERLKEKVKETPPVESAVTKSLDPDYMEILGRVSESVNALGEAAEEQLQEKLSQLEINLQELYAEAKAQESLRLLSKLFGVYLKQLCSLIAQYQLLKGAKKEEYKNKLTTLIVELNEHIEGIYTHIRGYNLNDMDMTISVLRRDLKENGK